VDERQRLQVIDLAGSFYLEARACAEAGAFHAACLMIGVALEAELLATAVTLEDQLRAQGLWPTGKGAPESWTFATLLEIALSAGWFPGKLGEAELVAAVKSLKYLRDFGAHPGRHIRDGADVRLGESDFRVAYHVLGETFDATLALVTPAGGSSWS
jgi:hypothetical protein